MTTLKILLYIPVVIFAVVNMAVQLRALASLPALMRERERE